MDSWFRKIPIPRTWLVYLATGFDFRGKNHACFGSIGVHKLASVSYLMKEGERGPFSPKLRVRIKDNNSSPHGKFYRFLLPFSSKFSDLNFASYVLYILIPT